MRIYYHTNIFLLINAATKKTRCPFLFAHPVQYTTLYKQSELKLLLVHAELFCGTSR